MSTTIPPLRLHPTDCRVRLAPDHESAYLPDPSAHHRASFERFVRAELPALLARVSPLRDPRGRLELTLSDPELGAPDLSPDDCRRRAATYDAPLRVQASLLDTRTGEITSSAVHLGRLPLVLPDGGFVVKGADKIVIGQLVRSPGLYLSRVGDPAGGALTYTVRVRPAYGSALSLSAAAGGGPVTARVKGVSLPVTRLLRLLAPLLVGGDPSRAAVAERAMDDLDPSGRWAGPTRRADVGATADEARAFARALHRGQPMSAERAVDTLRQLVADPLRYDLGTAGRFVLNRRLGRPAADGPRLLTLDDLVGALDLLLRACRSAETPAGAWPADDLDHLANRRLRLVGDFLGEVVHRALLRLRAYALDHMAGETAPPGALAPGRLLATRHLDGAVQRFFGASPFVQQLDQQNPLAVLKHRRTFTVLGPGGLTLDQAGVAVRDIHYTHYGRWCPIETPEGQKVGLVGRLAAFAVPTALGFLTAPYRRVLHRLPSADPRLIGRRLAADVTLAPGRVASAGAIVTVALAEGLARAGVDDVPIAPWVSDEVVWLTADEEDRQTIARGDAPRDADGRLAPGHPVAARRGPAYPTVRPEEVDLIDLSPRQLFSIAANLSPYARHDDAYRLTMAANMASQAVAPLRPQPPLVATGMERHAARGSGRLVLADAPGTVVSATARRVLVRGADGRDVAHPLRRLVRGAGDTLLSQRPAVRRGDHVSVGDVLADCEGSAGGELALGQNVLVAYLPFEGGNFEDALIISRALVREDRFTSLHVDEYTCLVRQTDHGPEELTASVPGLTRRERAYLDEDGLPRVGARVGGYDILVGKVTPRPDPCADGADLSPEEHLARAVVGAPERPPRDTSLRLPHGGGGRVTAVRVDRPGGEGVDLDPERIVARVTVTVMHRRRLVEGDKMCLRHGNKGVVARILPREDMPFLPDGTPVDIVLNSVGVPKRMNIGQLCEAHLGLAAAALGYSAACPAFADLPEVRWRADLRAAGLPADGKVTLCDGKTGEPYEQPVTVGVVYMLKLHHLVEDKIHARSVPVDRRGGGYAAVTQQPIGGKAHGGGQRVGEMEAWALEAYGAAHLLRELFTLKSDDVARRPAVLEALMTGTPLPEPGEPAAFGVLRAELAALCFGLDDGPDGLTIRLAGPHDILSWSHGPIENWRTVHHRTLRPEPGGLCCAAVFGPERDYTCLCGRYAGEAGRAAAASGVAACDRCRTPLLPRAARRERLAHIPLALPVAHTLYVHGTSDRLATLLGLRHAEATAVVYYTAALVLAVDEERRRQLAERMPDATTRALLEGLSPGVVVPYAAARELERTAAPVVRLGWGAEALRQRLAALDLGALADELAARLDAPGLAPERARALRTRLVLVETLRASGVAPAHLVLSALPVFPADLRPVLLLPGNRLATTDLTRLYEVVLQRNARVQRLRDMDAPALILHEAGRGLQYAVDALFANGHRGLPAVTDEHGRSLTSLLGRLGKKGGRFRANLLGKRVDFSGRSVIVVASDLALHQCGLPKALALALFRPLVVERLVARGAARSPRAAGRLIDRRQGAVWDALEEAMRGRAVLLNRAPTLHRLGIQAFEPVLVEGAAIHLHPLVCAAFNADFDGDQMAVHLPLSPYAQLEAKTLLLSTRNLLSPAGGDPVVAPAKEIALGLYGLTRHVAAEDADRPPVFPDADTALVAAAAGRIGWHAQLLVHVPAAARSGIAGDDTVIDTAAGRLPRTDLRPIGESRARGVLTTPGRLLVAQLLPPGSAAITAPLTKGTLRALLVDAHRRRGPAALTRLAEELCRLGFTWATRGGYSLSVDDLAIPREKAALMERMRAEIARRERKMDALGYAPDDAAREEMRYRVRTEARASLLAATRAALGPDNPVRLMNEAGAVASDPVQLQGARGTFADTSNRVIDVMVESSLREGLHVIEYFVAARGARKGLVDTAVRTREAGYLTRRLVDHGQDVLVRDADCGTSEGLTIACEEIPDDARAAVAVARLTGRVLAADARDINDRPVALAGAMVDEALAAILAAGLRAGSIATVTARSPLCCATPRGVCQACYGWSLATRRPAPIGEAVGIIAAQSIGEPGTQLTMRTFHTGGVAASDITQGLPRVEQLLENRAPRARAIVALDDGVARVEETARGRCLVIEGDEEADSAGRRCVRHVLPAGVSTSLDETPRPVRAGDVLTSGTVALDDIMALHGATATGWELVRAIQEVYRDQGVDIHDKHVEVVARQMLRRAEVLDPGDSALIAGSRHDVHTIAVVTAAVLAQGGQPPVARRLLLGITRSALTADSFLSAAAFQDTGRVLSAAALAGRTDPLRGIKENLMVGRLVPAGPAAAVAAGVETAAPPMDARPIPSATARTMSRRRHGASTQTVSIADACVANAG